MSENLREEIRGKVFWYRIARVRVKISPELAEFIQSANGSVGVGMRC
jgi:hypothetical protein